MAANNHSSAVGLLSIGAVSRRYSISQTTIRRAHAKGDLKAYVLPSGHRRLKVSEIEKWLGVDEEKNGQDCPICLIHRVSSHGQDQKKGKSDKSSLDHQIKEVREYVEERWGPEAYASAYIYTRISGGMNYENEVFQRFVTDLATGKFKNGYIVATYFDRVMRNGIEIVETLCKIHNTQIIYINTQSDDEDPMSEMMLECIATIQHYCAKVSGQKTRLKLKVYVDQHHLKEMWQLHQQGMSYQTIAEKFKDRPNEKGQFYTKNIVRTELIENQAALSKLLPQKVDKSSWDRFCEAKIRKGGQKTRLGRKAVIEAYRAFCEENGLVVLSSNKIGRQTKKMGWEKKFNGKGNIVFCGLSLIQ